MMFNNSFTVIAVGDVDQSRFQTFVFATKAFIFRIVNTVIQRVVFEYIFVHRQVIVHGQVAYPYL